jgi:hypothetical protein
MYLPLQVEGLGGGRPILHLLATLASPSCLFQRIPPRAVEFHDLGTMHQALAAEGHHVGLLLTPLRQGSGPLLGAAQRKYLLTSRDHTAINYTGDDGR